MANRLNLTDSINEMFRTGKQPTQLDALEDITGTIASGTPVENITAVDETHALNSTFSDTEVEAALDALGTQINLIIAALEAFGIAAEA